MVNTNLNSDWSHLQGQDLIDLENLAEVFYTFAGKRAMAILNFFHDESYFIPPAYGDNNFQWRSISFEDEQKHRELKLYPNPASSMINVELDYTGTREVPDKLIIRNSLGQVVKVIPVRGNRDFKTIDVREWTSGLYFYSLMGTDQTLDSGKFEILK